MTTPSSKLSPVRCGQLRAGGILRLMVQLLHEDTFVPHNQPEENTNIKSFLEDFNRKFSQRQKLSFEIRTIIENTTKDADELEILDCVESLRDYTECLYRFLTNVPKSKPEIFPPISTIEKLIEIMKESYNDRIKKLEMFEQFGGVYAILDLIRAQRRFFFKFNNEVIYSEVCALVRGNTAKPNCEVSCVDESQKSPETITSQETAIEHIKHRWSDPRHVRAMNYRLLTDFLTILSSNRNTWCGIYFKSLWRSRWMLDCLVGTIEEAYKDNYCHFHGLVVAYKDLISNMGFHTYESITLPHPRRHLYIVDCGFVRCLTKLVINIEDKSTKFKLLQTIDRTIYRAWENASEFCSVEGSIDMLIDIGVSRGETDEDVDNLANKIEKEELNFFLKMSSLSLLGSIAHCLLQNGAISMEGKQLLTIFESRDICAILVHTLSRPLTRTEIEEILKLLTYILKSSDNQRQKFAKSEEAQAIVKKFLSPRYAHIRPFRYKYLQECFENVHI